VSRQTKAVLAAIVGLLAGLGLLAVAYFALRDTTDNESSAPAISDTGALDTVETGAVVTETVPEQTEPIEVGGFPNALAVGFRSVWVLTDGRRLARLDPRTNKVSGLIGIGEELGSDRPCGVAVGEGAVWLTTLEGRLARVGRQTGRLARVIPTDEAACVAAGAGGVWVTSPNRGVVTRVDPETFEIVAEIPLDGFPQGIAVGFGSVWVAAGDPPDGAHGGVSRIDPSTTEVVRTILVPHLPVPNRPEFLATGAGSVWLTSNNGTIAQVDPRANQLVDTIRVTDGGRMSVAASGSAVYAIEITGPGEDAPIFVIDPETGEVSQAPVEAGDSPLGMDFGANSLWIANSGEGTITRYTPAPAGQG
jgi:streptogramin lyase